MKQCRDANFHCRVHLDRVIPVLKGINLDSIFVAWTKSMAGCELLVCSSTGTTSCHRASFVVRGLAGEKNHLEPAAVFSCLSWAMLWLHWETDGIELGQELLDTLILQGFPSAFAWRKVQGKIAGGWNWSGFLSLISGSAR